MTNEQRFTILKDIQTIVSKMIDDGYLPSVIIAVKPGPNTDIASACLPVIGNPKLDSALATNLIKLAAENPANDTKEIKLDDNKFGISEN